MPNNIINTGRSEQRSFVACLAASLAIWLGCTGCARESFVPTLDLDALHELSPSNSAGLSYEESNGDVLVTVVDKYGDAHVHKLVLEGVSKTEALKLLRQKRAELEKH